MLPLLSFLCQTASAGFMSGNELKDFLDKREERKSMFSSGIYKGYITGIMDLGNDLTFCMPDGATVGQGEAIVTKYLNNHPERWNEAAALLVIDALSEAFPCQKTEIN